MKIRLGFVSNSSTASFLIATKQELTQDMLEIQLNNLFRNERFAKKAMSLLWEGINYEILYESKPYELDFYEITLDQGEFHYYPGFIADEGLQYLGWFGPYERYNRYKGLSMTPHKMYGFLIDERDFKFCIGYFKKGELRRKHVKVKDKIHTMEGIKLYLRYNDIENINEILDIDKLNHLMILDLSKNKISNLKGFDKLKELKKLNLSDNFIKDLNDLESSTLELLDISSNQIKVINGIRKLPALESLRVTNNKIERVVNLKSNKIKYLNLSNNVIQEFDNVESESLEYLHLSNNRIERIGRINLPNLRSISLDNNPLETIEGLEDLKKEDRLYLFNTKFNNNDNF